MIEFAGGKRALDTNIEDTRDVAQKMVSWSLASRKIDSIVLQNLFLFNNIMIRLENEKFSHEFPYERNFPPNFNLFKERLIESFLAEIWPAKEFHLKISISSGTREFILIILNISSSENSKQRE